MQKYITAYIEAEETLERLEDDRLNALDILRVAQKNYEDAQRAAQTAQVRNLALIADMLVDQATTPSPIK